MSDTIIKKYVKDYYGLLEEMRKVPLWAVESQTPPYEQALVFTFGYLFRFFKFDEPPEFNDAFPDAQILFNGKLLFLEFERFSGDFVTHKHDPNKCDLIICWIDDWEERPFHIDVLELEPLWEKAYERAKKRL
jgi:hypothetical protein